MSRVIIVIAIVYSAVAGCSPTSRSPERKKVKMNVASKLNELVIDNVLIKYDGPSIIVQDADYDKEVFISRLNKITWKPIVVTEGIPLPLAESWRITAYSKGEIAFTALVYPSGSLLDDSNKQATALFNYWVDFELDLVKNNKEAWAKYVFPGNLLTK